MIVKEQIGEFIKTYSDRGMMIRGGNPEGLYSEALDIEDREYVETDIPIEENAEELLNILTGDSND